MGEVDRLLRGIVLSTLATLLCITVVGLAYSYYGETLTEIAYLNRWVSKIEAYSLSEFQWKVQEVLFRWAGRGLIAVVAFQMTLLVVAFRKRITFAVRSYFVEPDSAYNLAAFRLIIFGLIWYCVDPHSIAKIASRPVESWVPPVGFLTLSQWIPINASLAFFAAKALLCTSALAFLGVFTRVSMAITVLLSWYVFLIPNLFGKVNHDYQHVWWFAVLLLLSPCYEVLSFDAWRKRRALLWAEEPARSAAYGLPLRLAWILIGVAYFFPGWKKFWVGGLDWFLSDNLKFWIWDKWDELGGWVPGFRIDHYPWLYKLGAFYTIAFEIAFIFLIFSKRWRWIAPISAILFHLSTHLFMDIFFFTLTVCLLSFIDWNRFRQRVLGGAGDFSGRALPSSPALWAVGSFLIAMNVVFGFQGWGQGWPFAGYPTFARLATPTKEVVEMEYTVSEGTRRLSIEEIGQVYSSTTFSELGREILKGVGTSQMVQKVTGISLALWEAGIIPKRATGLRFLKVQKSTDPDRRSERPISEETLLEVSLPPSSKSLG